MESAVRKIQSLWRGYSTRKKLYETRVEYETICKEIEESMEDIEIKWPYKSLCRPVIKEKIVNSNSKSLSGTNKNERESKGLMNGDPDKLKDMCKTSDNSTSTLPNQKLICGEEPKNNTLSETVELTSRDSGLNCLTEESFSTENAVLRPVNSTSPLRHVDLIAYDRSCQTSLCFDESNDIEHSTPRFSKLHETHMVKMEGSEEPVTVFKQVSSRSCTRSLEQKLVVHEGGSETGNEKATPTDDRDDITRCCISVKTSSELLRNKDLEPKPMPKPNKQNILTESWLSDKSFLIDDEVSMCEGKTSDELYKMKEELSLEVLWLQQAITSRKTYLKMKQSAL